MRRFFARFANLFQRGRAEREMAREIAAHLALLQEDFECRGLSPHEAALAARRAYGGVEQSKELHREARSFVWIEQLLKDVRYGSRNLLRAPGFTLVAVIALALGIGVNATVFGVFNAVALKQLPVAGPSRVVRIKRWSRFFARDNFAYPEYEYLRDHNGVFSGLTAASAAIPVLASIAGGAPEHLSVRAVSANYFACLGVNARLGRVFMVDEDRAAGANAVVVLNYRFWQRKYLADPNVIGQTIKLNGMAYTIAGIAPPDFSGTGVHPTETSFWVPISMIEQLNPGFGAGWRADNEILGFELLARLKNGVARAQAQAEVDAVMRGYLAGYRETQPTTKVTLHRASYFGNTDDIGFRAAAAAFLMVVSLVLVVACANVANMLLARGVARQREIGIRLALGAGRARIIRQLLMESILLSVFGGAAGILLSTWAGRLLWMSLTGIAPGLRGSRIDLDVSPDGHVLIYGLALSVFTGICFGLVPAVESTRADVNTAIQQEGWRWGRRHGRSWLRGLLLGGQVTVSVLLLVVSGGLMSGVVSSFVKAGDLGFDAHATYRVGVNSTGIDGAMERLRDRLETRPELSGVAIGWAPLELSLPVQMTAGKWSGQTVVSFASDAYFETLGIRLVRGRDFTRQEAGQGAPEAVISESTARRLWPSDDPLGQHFTTERGKFLKFSEYEVVGVAKDVHFVNITEFDPLHVYLPSGSAQRMMGGLLVHIRGNRDKALAAVGSAVESVDPRLLPSLNLMSLEDGPVALQRSFYRVVAAFAGTLTLLSLTLAGIGIYGVMAFLVSQRTREIGIRMALGASSGVVINNVVVQGLRPVFGGTLLGLAGAARVAAWARASGVAGQLNLFTRIFSEPVLYGELALVLGIAVLALRCLARVTQ